MKYGYLLINFLTILFPVLLSFDKNVAFYKSWKYIWPGMVITGLFFLVWDLFFTAQGVWSFNDDYILGIKILQLPIEEVLFFLTVPFACIFIYACLNRYVKWELPAAVADTFTSAIIIYALLNCCFNYNKLYTLVTLALTFCILILVRFVFKAPWLNRFYLAYIVCLLPFYLVNGFLTSIPIVMYNNAQNLHTRIAAIPIEDHFYLLVLLLMNIAFFEYFKNKDVGGQKPDVRIGTVE